MWDSDTENMLAERRALLKKEDPSESDKERLAFLDDWVLSLDVASKQEDREAMDLIRKAAEMLKENSPKQ